MCHTDSVVLVVGAEVVFFLAFTSNAAGRIPKGDTVVLTWVSSGPLSTGTTSQPKDKFLVIKLSGHLFPDFVSIASHNILINGSGKTNANMRKQTHTLIGETMEKDKTNTMKWFGESGWIMWKFFLLFLQLFSKFERKERRKESFEMKIIYW